MGSRGGREGKSASAGPERAIVSFPGCCPASGAADGLRVVAKAPPCRAEDERRQHLQRTTRRRYNTRYSYNVIVPAGSKRRGGRRKGRILRPGKKPSIQQHGVRARARAGGRRRGRRGAAPATQP